MFVIVLLDFVHCQIMKSLNYLLEARSCFHLRVRGQKACLLGPLVELSSVLNRPDRTLNVFWFCFLFRCQYHLVNTWYLPTRSITPAALLTIFTVCQCQLTHQLIIKDKESKLLLLKVKLHQYQFLNLNSLTL